jgi:hypothetical protein
MMPTMFLVISYTIAYYGDEDSEAEKFSLFPC